MRAIIQLAVVFAYFKCCLRDMSISDVGEEDNVIALDCSISEIRSISHKHVCCWNKQTSRKQNECYVNAEWYYILGLVSMRLSYITLIDVESIEPIEYHLKKRQLWKIDDAYYSGKENIEFWILEFEKTLPRCWRFNIWTNKLLAILRKLNNNNNNKKQIMRCVYRKCGRVSAKYNTKSTIFWLISLCLLLKIDELSLTLRLRRWCLCYAIFESERVKE